MLWSRPETKKTRGKLLIVGGNSQAFTAPAQAYTEALEAGAGTVKILLPAKVQKLLPKTFSEMEFAPDTPSGSFARQSLAELLDAAVWADAVMLAGDFGKNSETAILLESFLAKYRGPLILSQDAVDYFVTSPQICERENTLIAADLSQLQKLATTAKLPTAITSKLDFLHFIDALHEFTSQCPLAVIINHLETTFISAGGQVSTNKPAVNRSPIELGAHASVWWLQNPGKPFESLTTSLVSG